MTIKNSKQVWDVGQSVKVGFVSGLTVAAKVPTPGDGAPDAYVLVRGDRVYSFVPHRGLTKITQDEARAMTAAAKCHADAEQVRAVAAADLAIKSAQFAAALMAVRAGT